MTTTLDVFISSKMLELKPERDALYALLPTLDYGDIKLHAWVFEEDAPASEQSIRDIYLKSLQNSALYLGLFWNQYGEWTIDEFERATEWGMERHIYVKDVDADNRTPQLTEFLNKHGNVTSGVTAKWFKTTDELCEAVKKTLDKWVADYRSGPLGEPNAWLYTTTAEIVERAEKLIGREDLITQVSTLLDQNEPVLLHGFSGSGKTALAAELASARTPALWLRVGRNNADALFESLALEFDAHQEIAKQTGEGKIRLMRSILARSNLKLLILDDAWNGQALQAVIRAVPPTLPLLVTSRRIYSLSHIVKIPDLSPDPAVELLGYHAEQPYTANKTAYELCALFGHLAFAVRIAGKVLKAQRWTPQKLFMDIENAPHTLTLPLEFAEPGRENVAKLLETSLNALDDETRSVFFTFGAFFAPALTGEMLRLYVGTQHDTSFPLSSLEKPLTTLELHGLVESIPAADNAHAH